VSKSRLQSRALFRYTPGVVGLALLIFLVVHAGPKALMANAKLVGWGLGLVIALGGLSHLVKAWAWRLTLPPKAHFSFSRMFGLRLVSEAIGQLGFPGVVAGEATRVSLLGSAVPLDARILSVTLDRGLFIVCGAIVTVTGITFGLLLLSLSSALRIYATLFALSFLTIVLVLAFAVMKGWPVLSGPARALACVPWMGPWIQSKESLVVSVEEKLLQFHRERPSAFWGSIALNFASHGLAILEVYVILLFLGKNVAFTGALILESFTKLINVVGSLTPGNVGIYEGGTMLIATLFGLNGTIGLTLGLCRRLRGLFWAVAGAFSFFFLSRSVDGHKKSGSSEALHKNKPVPLKETPSDPHSEAVTKTITAIVSIDDYRNGRGFTPELARVGTLPIVLRTILQAQSVDAKRIVVTGNRLALTVIRRELLRTSRLPKTVEWLETTNVNGWLPRLFGQLAADSDLILFASGSTVCHPWLFQAVSEWNGQSDAVALTTDGQFVGIGALSRQGALEIARDCPAHVQTLPELYAWFKPEHSVAFKAVETRLWHVVNVPVDRLSAERKLDQWLVKPTDGRFARMNRRISVPISRQLIKFPITPNMVTLFTLGVSFLAGVFFALGGYWNTVLGALLSVWASILDGCDGEVARLKLQVSKFGCWLETICDYLYYIFIFVGMSIGLTRSHGTQAYLLWGALLIIGAVVSFLAVGSARHRFAANNPERFLDVWQKKADKQTRNPLMYIARQTEFIIRRCFFPYALLAFAILSILHIAFIMTAIGANLVWMIALYSYWILSKPPSRVQPPAGKRRRPAAVSGTVLPASHGAD
jgi:phosphatidylglycerophosphate synthase